jgi:outer membrane autotransporter protein
MQYAGTRKKKRATDAFAQFERKPQTQPDRWHVWSSAFGAWQSVSGDSSAGTAGFTQNTYGMTVGVDRQLNRDFLFGMALGASRGTFSVPDRSTSGSAEGAHVGLYSMYRQNPFYIASNLSYAHFDNSTTRVISGVGPTETANGGFGSNQVSGRVEIGRRSLIGRYVVTPFAGFGLSALSQNGYSETSTLNSSPSTPGTLGLTYQAQTTVSAKSSLGAQVESSYTMPNGMRLLPFARLAWVHEFNPNREITAAFNVASSVPFVTSGTQAASDTGRINAGFNLRANPAASVFLSFSGEFASGSQFYGVNGGYRIGW